MLKNPARKYLPVKGPVLTDRQWPGVSIARAPQWLSTDLRDGNQALFEPMDVQRKLRLFNTLLAVGFKEIEVAFPAASQMDFDFTRRLIEGGLIPDDVTIMVMTQARADLIERTFEALKGAKRATISLYNATAPVWRRDVFGLSQNEVLHMAVAHTRIVRQHFEAHPETQWVLQYSPEAFSATEMPFAAEICNAVIDALGPTPQRPMIINLPATVEVSTPNVFADQVEWMHRHLNRRESVILSVHPHNDRGTAVAAAEMAVMAGAQRIEGCLFGQGERSGNVDLVTVALNLYTQGIDPGLDFSNIDETLHVVEQCSQLPISPRHPYAGELVYTAFSGSHQDAIHKGLTRHRLMDDGPWEVPYLPIDPADLGRDYASVIRVNSQSGKGGTAYLLESHYGLKLPRRMQIDFSPVVQHHTEHSGREVTATTLLELWLKAYQPDHGPRLISYQVEPTALGINLTMALSCAHTTQAIGSMIVAGTGGTLLEAALNAMRDSLGWPMDITLQEAQASGHEPDQERVIILESAWAGMNGRQWGIGLHADADTATLMGLLHCAAAWLAREAAIVDAAEAQPCSQCA